MSPASSEIVEQHLPVECCNGIKFFCPRGHSSVYVEQQCTKRAFKLHNDSHYRCLKFRYSNIIRCIPPDEAGPPDYPGTPHQRKDSAMSIRSNISTESTDSTSSTSSTVVHDRHKISCVSTTWVLINPLRSGTAEERWTRAEIPIRDRELRRLCSHPACRKEFEEIQVGGRWTREVADLVAALGVQCLSRAAYGDSTESLLGEYRI